MFEHGYIPAMTIDWDDIWNEWLSDYSLECNECRWYYDHSEDGDMEDGDMEDVYDEETVEVGSSADTEDSPEFEVVATHHCYSCGWGLCTPCFEKHIAKNNWCGGADCIVRSLKNFRTQKPRTD
jgi:hypothetical protein